MTLPKFQCHRGDRKVAVKVVFFALEFLSGQVQTLNDCCIYHYMNQITDILFWGETGVYFNGGN